MITEKSNRLQVIVITDYDYPISGIVNLFWPNKKIIVVRVTGLKILGRVGTHFFLEIFFYAF